MNPRILLLVIATLAILSSCTKETFTPITEEPLNGSAIELNYETEASNLPETYEINDRSRPFAPPPSVEQDCKSKLPSLIVPKMYNGRLEFIYAKNNSYTGTDFGKIKTRKWVVNGIAHSNPSATLQLLYRSGDIFDIELTATFVGGATQEFSFTFEASSGIQTLSDGTILHSTGAGSFSGSTISESCGGEANRGTGIVIVETDI